MTHYQRRTKDSHDKFTCYVFFLIYIYLFYQGFWFKKLLAAFATSTPTHPTPPHPACPSFQQSFMGEVSIHSICYARTNQYSVYLINCLFTFLNRSADNKVHCFKKCIYTSVCLMFGSMAMLVKEHGLTVFGVCIIYDCLVINKKFIWR